MLVSHGRKGGHLRMFHNGVTTKVEGSFSRPVTVGTPSPGQRRDLRGHCQNLQAERAAL